MKNSVLQIPFPDEILLETGLSEQHVIQKMRQLFVIDLYTHHQISSGKGAEILGIRKYDFIRLLAEAGVAYFDYPANELDDEFSAVDQWEAQHG